MPLAPEVIVQNPGNVQRALGWLVVGAGVAGLGAAAYFGGKWLDEHNSRSASRRNDATAQGDNAEAALGGALAALFVGTCIVVTSPGPRLVPRATTRLELAPVVGPSRGGVALRAVW
jgi:hypothetical protein